jgi:hypothetical protein
MRLTLVVLGFCVVGLLVLLACACACASVLWWDAALCPPGLQSISCAELLLYTLHVLQDILTDLSLVPSSLEPEGVTDPGQQAWKRRDAGSAPDTSPAPNLEAAVVRTKH